MRVLGDGGGDVGAGEAEAGEEGEDGVGIGRGLEVGELRGGFDCLGSGEAAGGDEVLLRREARVWGNSRGEEAVDRGDGGDGGGVRRGEETGEDAAPEV